METKAKNNRRKKEKSVVRVNPALDKFDDVVLFPEKLKAANEVLAKVTLPSISGK